MNNIKEKMSHSTHSGSEEHWVNCHWRPMMGWIYMITCIFDFIVAPILWTLLQAKLGQPIIQWEPLTLQGAGLYHIAMGAVLGVTAYGRTQEKLGGVSNNRNISPTTGYNGKLAPPVTDFPER